MKERIALKNHAGFSLISIITVLAVLCILITIELARHLSPATDKGKLSETPKSIKGMAAARNDNSSNETKNIAGIAAFDAAAENVRMAYSKLLRSNASLKTVSDEAVVNLLTPTMRPSGIM